MPHAFVISLPHRPLDAVHAGLLAALPVFVRHVSLAMWRPDPERQALKDAPLPRLEPEELLPARAKSDRWLRTGCVDPPCEGHCDRYLLGDHGARGVQLTVLSSNGPGGRICLSISASVDGDAPCGSLSVELDDGVTGLVDRVRDTLRDIFGVR